MNSATCSVNTESIELFLAPRTVLLGQTHVRQLVPLPARGHRYIKKKPNKFFFKVSVPTHSMAPLSVFITWS